MADRLNVSILMRLVDGVTGPIRRVSHAVAVASKGIEAARLKADKAFERAANIRQAAEGVNSFAMKARAAVAIPLGVAEEFEAKLSKLGAISGASGDQFDLMKQKALKLGADTSFSASQAADAMTEMATAGFNVNEVLTATGPMMDLAAAAGMDLGHTAQISSNMLRGFQLPASDSGRVANVLTKAFTSSSTTLGDLSETMIYAGPVAAGLGITLEQTAAMAALLGDAGIKGSMAGTALRAALTNLTTPRGKGGKVLSMLGIDTIDQDTKKLRPLGDILVDIKAKTDKFGSAKQSAALTHIFGVEAVSSMMALMAQGPEKLKAMTASLEQSAGAAGNVATKMLNNSQGASEQLSGSIETLSITLGEVLLPTVTQLKIFLVDVVNGITNWVKAHPTLTKVVVFTVAAVAALSTVLAGLLFTIATVVSAKGLLLLIGSYKALAIAIWRFAIPASVKWGITTMISVVRTSVVAAASLAMLPIRFIAAGVAATGAAAPFIAIGAAIAAVTLAVRQLVKYWDDLNFGEVWDGIKTVVGEEGVGSMLKQMFDPSALISSVKEDLGISEAASSPTTRADASGTLLGPADTAGTLTAGGKREPPRGLIEVKIDSEGRPTVGRMQARGLELEAEAGMTMVGAQ